MDTKDHTDLDADDSVFAGYDIRFTVERSLMASEEPSDFVIDVRGELLYGSSRKTREEVGWVSARVVHAGRACNEEQSLFDVCDSIDQSLYDYASAVLDLDSGSIRESVSDGCAGADVLIVESIQVVPAHRGRRLGLLAMRRTIDTFGQGCAVVVIKPYPLQFSGIHNRRSPEKEAERAKWDARMAMKSLGSDQRAASRKLRKYWSRVGFERVGKTDYFVLDLQLAQPGYDDLIK